MRHVLVLLALLTVLLLVLAREASPDPYTYDEADYMFAASRGFLANYTDSSTLPIADFVRTGLARGRDPSQRQALSELIRTSNDMVFYRHWHGPLYLYFLLPVSRLAGNEQFVRTCLLVIPALTLAAIYAACLWLMPGPRGALAALLGAALFISSGAVIHSTELAPHHLFALCSVCCVALLAKSLDTGRRVYWYSAVVAAGLAFCTLEIAFVLLITLAVTGYVGRRCWEADWSFAARSLALFLATVLIAWPAAIYKLSFLKGYLFMAYLAVYRRNPWGDAGFFDTWRDRFLDSPLEWAAVLAALIIYLRSRPRPGRVSWFPILLCAALMIVATLRVFTNSARYSLLFMPLLDLFAALTLVPFLAALSRRAAYATLGLACGLLAINEYRLFAHSHAPDPRSPAVLVSIRENGLEDKALLVPQDDLPMIHYYFPRARLRGFSGVEPVGSGGHQFTPDAILYPGYPIRLQRIR